MNPSTFLHRASRVTLLTASLVGIALGAVLLWRDVYLLSSLPSPPWIPFACFILSGGLLWYAERATPGFQPSESHHYVDRGEPPVQHYALRPAQRYVSICLALALAGFVLFSLGRVHSGEDYGPQSLAWAVSIVIFSLAYAPRSLFLEESEYASPRNRPQFRQIGVVIALCIAGLILRLAYLAQIPFTLSGDEAAQGLEALRVINGDLSNPFAIGWRGVPAMSFHITALSIRLLGQTIEALRFPWVLVGVATIPLAYWLVSRLLGRAVGLIAASLLATYHYAIHFSRLGSNQAADAFLATLAVLALSFALKRNQPLYWIVAGATAGFSFYLYAGARFVPVLVLLLLACEVAIHRRGFLSRYGRGLASGATAFLLVSAPLLQTAYRAPDAFNQRVLEAGILQSGWLEHEAHLRESSKASVLFDQFLRAALAFHYYPDRRGWYDFGQPLLDPLFGSLLAVGMTYAILSVLVPPRNLRTLPFLIWWWGVVILGGALTESPPSSQRLTSLVVPTCVFIALAVVCLTALARQVWRRVPPWPFYVAAVALFAITSLTAYLGRYSAERHFGGPYAELATATAGILSRRSSTHTIYLLGAPDLYSDFPTFAYLAPTVTILDLSVPVETLLPSEVSQLRTPALFLVVPRRLPELTLLEEYLAGGTVTVIERERSGTVIGAIYSVP